MGKCGKDGMVGQGRDMRITRGTIQRYTWCWPLRGCCETSPSMGCMGARETGRSRVERGASHANIWNKGHLQLEKPQVQNAKLKKICTLQR